MKNSLSTKLRPLIGSVVLLGSLAATAGALASWKQDSQRAAESAAASQPAPTESVTAVLATEREHRRTTTTIGTVVALQSITLHNELPGTVREVRLTPGQIVEAGTLLVALDVTVEEAELRAQEAQAALARTTLERLERAQARSAASAVDVDRARAERDVALAQVARTKAVIARKTIRAPFRARVGMADVHLGQYLHEGTRLTTLQGIDEAVHVDFAVTQAVAAGLRPGDRVEAVLDGTPVAGAATIVAVDARVDPTTRNAIVRARIEHPTAGLAPGASVPLRVPVGPAATVVTVPVSALRRGPSGDHVFVLSEQDGLTRAHQRSVRSGTVLGDEVVILQGLESGERVAASGSFKLYESALVAIASTDQNGGDGDGDGERVALASNDRSR